MTRKSYQPSREQHSQPRDVAVDDDAPRQQNEGAYFAVSIPRTHSQCTHTVGTTNEKNNNLQVCSSTFVAIPCHFGGFCVPFPLLQIIAYIPYTYMCILFIYFKLYYFYLYNIIIIIIIIYLLLLLLLYILLYIYIIYLFIIYLYYYNLI